MTREQILRAKAVEIGLVCPECGRTHMSAHAPHCSRPNGNAQWISRTTKKQLAGYVAMKRDAGLA